MPDPRRVDQRVLLEDVEAAPEVPQVLGQGFQPAITAWTRLVSQA